MSIILTQRQQDIVRWYWTENRTIGEIAEWAGVAGATIERDLMILRAIFKSHGKILPKFNGGRPRYLPVLSDIPVG